MNLRSLHLLRARRDDERGAILVLSVLFLVVMIIACALAIDLGQQAKDKRDDHKVADLVSLDAVRALDDINGACTDDQQQTYVNQKAAEAAQRNGYDPAAAGNNLAVDIGNLDPNTKAFTPAAAGQKCWPNSKAVRVTVNSVTNYHFLPGSASQLAKAISAVSGTNGTVGGKQGYYMMGSYLGSIDSSDSAVLNKVLGKMFKGSDLSGTLVGWQGAATTAITLDALRQKLTADGVDVGTDDKLMNSQIQLSKIMTAESQALSDQGTVASGNASTLVGQIATGVNGSTTMSVGQIMGVSQGQGQALAAQANETFLPALGTLTSAAQIANGNNFGIADLGLGIPGVTKTALSLTAISPPVRIGPDAGASNTTNQVHLTVTPTLNTPVTIPGLAGVQVTGDLPLLVDGGGAQGTLVNPDCVNNPGLSAHVVPQPYTTKTGPNDTLGVSATLLGLQTAVANVTLQASQTWTSTTPPDHRFLAPTDFPSNGPPPVAGQSVRMGSNTIGLDTQTYTATTTVLGGAVSGTIIGNSTISGLTSSILPQLNSKLTRLVQLLGLELGGADVAADQMICTGQINPGGAILPVLVG
jgi:uncharacterized membrane protein